MPLNLFQLNFTSHALVSFTNSSYLIKSDPRSDPNLDLSYVVLGGDPGQPNGTSKTEEQGATGGEQTASAASGEFRKVTHPFFFSTLAWTLFAPLRQNVSTILFVGQSSSKFP